MREELHPHGIEIVTIALDRRDAAEKFIERAAPRHPALIDEHHVMDALFGVVNVPSGIWIDESGVIVRPPEPAWPGRSMFREMMKQNPITLPDDADPYIKKSLEQTARIETAPERYLSALRDWVTRGAESRFALRPDQVLERSKPRDSSVSAAAAHFELGQHLHALGAGAEAVEHFKRAHELQPENWTYKRQAWQYVNPLLQNAREVYGTSWADEIEAAGAENYYPIADDIRSIEHG